MGPKKTAPGLLRKRMAQLPAVRPDMAMNSMVRDRRSAYRDR